MKKTLIAVAALSAMAASAMAANVTVSASLTSDSPSRTRKQEATLRVPSR